MLKEGNCGSLPYGIYKPSKLNNSVEVKFERFEPKFKISTFDMSLKFTLYKFIELTIVSGCIDSRIEKCSSEAFQKIPSEERNNHIVIVAVLCGKCERNIDNKF